MFTYLQDLMVCPKCKSDMIWNIRNETDRDIIDADVFCENCGQKYFIKDGIGNFLIDFQHTATTIRVEGKNNPRVKYFDTHSEIKDRLLNSAPELLNSVDLDILYEYLLNSKETLTFEEKAYIEYIDGLSKLKSTPPSARLARNLLHKYVTDILLKKQGFALDIASGAGGSVRSLLENTELDIIASDISYRTLVVNYNDISYNNKKRLSLITFDANYCPFQDNSIKIMTSDFCLTEIPATNNLANELYRICSDVIYSQEIFYPEGDLPKTKEKSDFFPDEFEILFKKDACIEMLKEAGFKISIENSLKYNDKKRACSEFIPGQWFNMFPVIDTVVEHFVIIMNK